MICTFIPAIEAKDMPEEVIDYCAEKEISTHYQNDIVWVDNDGNPLAKWLISLDVLHSDTDGIWIGIFAT